MQNHPPSRDTSDSNTTESPTIYCRRCGIKNDSKAEACTGIDRDAGKGCGAKLNVDTEAECANCDKPLKINARYCTHCGEYQRVFEPPVAWLLGQQLIASLKWILLYTAFGTKLDARDWMDAKVYSFDQKASDEQVKSVETSDLTESQEISIVADQDKQPKDFWFDYISDTGDGMTATYSIAYLCLSNLWVKGDEAKKPPELPLRMPDNWTSEGKVPELYSPEDKIGLRLDHQITEIKAEKRISLPRGQFLLVGGDTSYHMSDYASLHIRFQTPFDWAYRDLEEDLKLVGKQIDVVEERETGANRRPLFGIPGNHDYYDMLDGFRRQFRLPIKSRPENKVYSNDDLSAPQLMSRGFKRIQESSYLALRLPFNWMLWGLDTEVGTIDERQRDFFLGLSPEGTPRKLIVATSAPTTVFGKIADPDDEKASKAFCQLKLRRCFLPGEKWTKVDIEHWEKEEGRTWDQKVALSPNQTRLDLAGDVHQYARYWGPESYSAQHTRYDNPQAEAPRADNYASVVSGLGGAFHHPSTTYVDEIREQALYPTADVSRRAVAREIFNPIKVLRGGGVFVLGGAIALVLTFAGIAADSSRPAIHNLLPFTALNITKPERYKLTVAVADATPTPQTGNSQARAIGESGVQSDAIKVVRQPQGIKPSRIWTKLGIVDDVWIPRYAPSDEDCSGAEQKGGGAIAATAGRPNQPNVDNQPKFLWGACALVRPLDFKIGMGMLLATVGVIVATFILSELTYKDSKKKDEAAKLNPKGPKERAAEQRAMTIKVNLILWLTFAANIFLGIVGVFSIMPYRDFITPFGNSLWVLLTMIWAVTSIIFSLRYSDWLFEQASKRKVGGWDWAITWGLAAAAVVSLAVGLWLFGKNNLPAYLVSDILFVTVVSATLILLIYVAVSMAGQHQKTGGKIFMGFLGFWHWLLQLGVALFLVKKGTWLTVVLAFFAVLIFRWLGRRLMEENKRWWLTLVWFVFGALMLILPPLVYAILSPHFDNAVVKWLFWPYDTSQASGFAAYEWWASFGGWLQLVPLAIAAVFGALLSCVWVGWYFGIALSFHGHNNEAGGAARIERFKQFIRFRLTEDGLTGYVIAVDDPNETGSKLQPKLIDVFHLKTPKASEAGGK